MVAGACRPFTIHQYTNHPLSIFTPTAGLDFSASRPSGQFEAMSNNRSLCFTIPVLSDDLVEDDESFLVSLRLRTNLSPGLRDGLVVDDRQLRVTIIDSSMFDLSLYTGVPVPNYEILCTFENLTVATNYDAWTTYIMFSSHSEETVGNG